MPNKNYIFLALSVVLITAVYILRLDTVSSYFDVDDKVRITGILSQEPKIFEEKQQIVFNNIRAYIVRFPEYHYGDKLVLEGIVKKSDYGFFLENPKVRKLEKEEDRGLLKFRKRFLEIFGFSLPSPFSSLAEGIVLGTKNNFDSSFYEALKSTGTLHVVVASGTNISLIGGLFLQLLSPITGRRIALLSSLSFIWIYVFFIGFDAPIIRAALMGSLVFTAQAFGRESMALRTLLITGIVMLFINPLWLFDLGFQLSFTATAGILLFSQKFLQITALMRFLPQVFKTDLATTLAAQVFVVPILFLNFGQISYLSPLVNMFVLWTVPIILVGGMIGGILGVIWEPLGKLAMILLYPFLWWFVNVVKFYA